LAGVWDVGISPLSPLQEADKMFCETAKPASAAAFPRKSLLSMMNLL
jgi:hypothetical protein